MQKMNMQLHEQQRRGPVSFQHSSACPYRFSQQSHKSAPTADRMNVSRCIIGHYRWPDYFVNVHEQSPRVILSATKGLSRSAQRSFAALRMTGLDLAGGEKLSHAFEPCLKYIIGGGHGVLIRAPLRFAEAPTLGCSPTNHSYAHLGLVPNCYFYDVLYYTQ